MSLLAVVILVIVIGLVATFAPIDARFKTLLYWLCAAVVLVFLLLLIFGAVDVGWPHERVIVH